MIIVKAVGSMIVDLVGTAFAKPRAPCPLLVAIIHVGSEFAFPINSARLSEDLLCRALVLSLTRAAT